MRYSIVIDQYHSIEWGLVWSEASVFSYLLQLPTWAERIELGGMDYYFANRHKIVEELPLVTDKPDTAYRILKKLQKKGLIDYQKYRGKDCVRMLPKGKVWNSQKAPKKAVKNSDSNPKMLGFKSEKDPKLGFKSEKTRIQIRKCSDSNPTDNNYNIISTTIDDIYLGEKNKNQKTDFDKNSVPDLEKCTPPVTPAPPTRTYLETEAAMKEFFVQQPGQKAFLLNRAMFAGNLNVEIEKFCEHYHEDYGLKTKPIESLIPRLSKWLRKAAIYQKRNQDATSGKTRNHKNLISEDTAKAAMLELMADEGY